MIEENPRRAKEILSVFSSDDNIVGAEVGVAFGCTSQYLFRHLPNLFLYQIDPYIDKEDMYDKFIKRMKGYHNRKFHKTTSQKAANQIPNNLNFVFIDAHHKYESVKNDISIWWPKVAVGGWLFGHDYRYRDFPGVVRAFNEFLGTIPFPCRTGLDDGKTIRIQKLS